ncbi:MAG: hypothetical protein L3J63_00850 [Geopsychrobacter sp.]|nr:hypothetical protein [Geopsychrobacter sp.]
MLLKNIIIFILFQVVLLKATNTWAKIEFTPRIALEEEYTDNLFLTASNASEDFITTLEPGLSLYAGNRHLQLDLDYALRFRSYQENSQRSQTDFDEIQRALANLTLWPGRKFSVLAREEISLQTIDVRNAVNTRNEIVNQALRYYSLASPRLHLPLTKALAVDVSYAYSREDYLDRRGDNTEQQRYEASSTYSLRQETSLSLGYTQIDQQAQRQEGYRQGTAFLGLQQELGARLLLNARLGQTRIDPQASASLDGQTWAVSLSYEFNSKAKILLGYNKDFSSSIINGVFDGKSLTADFDYSGKFDFSLGVFLQDNNYLSQLRTDRRLGVRTAAKIPLYRRFNFNLSADFEQLDFRPDNEEVQRYNIETGLDYAIAKGRVALSYQWNLNDSNLAFNDYTNNLVILNIDLRY